MEGTALLGHRNEGIEFLNETWCGLLTVCLLYHNHCVNYGE